MSIIDVIGLWITVPLFLLLAGGIVSSALAELTRERKRKP